MSLTAIHEFTNGLKAAYCNLNFEQFCKAFGCHPQDPGYSVERWHNFHDLIDNMSRFSDESLTKLIAAGIEHRR